MRGLDLYNYEKVRLKPFVPAPLTK